MPEGELKPFRWNDDKNSKLNIERGINFETVVQAMSEGGILATIQHPNSDKYPSQKIFVVEVNQYVYLVPFVENDQEIFLKTIIPSRKMKKKYLGD